MTARSHRKTNATLLVGISNPATAEQLVRISNILAGTGRWTILLTHVVTVADQISLTTAQSSPDVVRARDLLQQVQAQGREAGVRVRALVEVARSVDEGLLAAAKSHNAAMILVGYSEPETEVEDSGEEERFDRTMHRVARRSAVPVVVAKFRGHQMSRVLVPVTAGAPLQATGLLCRALGGVGGTELTFLHVVSPDASLDAARTGLEELLKTRGVASLGSLRLVTSHDPVEAVVVEATGQDLVIVGPSGRPGLLSAIFSNKSQRIAEEAACSVLLVWNRDVVKA